jgi:membrane fusion protein (multidrug efflux system)
MSQTAKRRLTAAFGGTVLLTVVIAFVFFLNGGNASTEASVPTDVNPDSDSPKVPVEVFETTRGSISSTLTSSSTIEAEQTAQIPAKVEGIVTTIKVREGDFVKAGQVLACLDTEEKTLALDKARLRLGKAEAEYQRAEQSFKHELISKFDYDKALFDRDLAKSELETAELELDYTQVRAPFTGRVTEKQVVVGKAVKKGDHLFTLADFNSLIARIFLPERDVFQLKRGQSAELALESRMDTTFEGRIRDISPVVDPKTGTVKITVNVTGRSTDLRPGAFVRVNIITDTHEQAVLVPKVALLKEDGEDYVYIARDAVAVKRSVRLGYTSDGMVEITDGIAPGEQVVVAGHTALKEKSPLEVLK